MSVDTFPSQADAFPVVPHWNDFYLTEQRVPFKEGVDAVQLQPEAQLHYQKLWHQEQALFELVDARLEQRDSPVTLDQVRELDLPTNVLVNNVSLASELYGRLGPHNEMERSDLLLTSLAGMVAEDLQQPDSNNKERLLPDVENPFERAVRITSAYAERVANQPELVKGKEREHLLLAELLSEAQHVPSRSRERVPELGNIYATDMDSEFYQASVVNICDALTSQITTELKTPAEAGSKLAAKRRAQKLPMLEGALLTKYDTLFDGVANAQASDPEAARKLLTNFAAEVHTHLGDLELGYGYELFMPLAFRYAALQAGQLDQVRIWHATTRSDMPRDRFGFKPQAHRPESEVGQHIKKQSHDVLIGQVDPRDAAVAHVTDRLQLKARTDAERFVAEYDSPLVTVHSADAAALLDTLHTTIARRDPSLAHQSEADKAVRLALAAEQVLVGMASEIHDRLQEPTVRGHRSFVVHDTHGDIPLDISQVLDETMLPIYQQLLDKSLTTTS